MSPTEDDVLLALRGVRDPELGMDVVSMGMIRDLVVRGGEVSFTLELTTPACPYNAQIERAVREAVESIPGVKAVKMKVTARVRQASSPPMQRMEIPGIKNIVAVGSGKGGVGKTTIAANLAAALAEAGASVGILDADIYGSSLTRFIRRYTFEARPGEKIQAAVGPLGLRMMSMGLLVPGNTPIIWRGPLVGGAVRQMLLEVDWGELDYLVVDLPPGTGDAPLTLVQTIPVTGAIIVTTPQQTSLDIALKSLYMFRKLNVEVLGIVENMSYYVCPHCGAREYIFGRDGAVPAAAGAGVPLLAQIPLIPRIRELSDSGEPTVIADSDSEAANAFRSLAKKVAAALSVLAVRRGAK